MDRTHANVRPVLWEMNATFKWKIAQWNRARMEVPASMSHFASTTIANAQKDGQDDTAKRKL